MISNPTSPKGVHQSEGDQCFKGTSCAGWPVRASKIITTTFKSNRYGLLKQGLNTPIRDLSSEKFTRYSMSFSDLRG